LAIVMLSEALQRNAKHEARLSTIQLLRTGDRIRPSAFLILMKLLSS
jgi:hypothetical protein